MVKVQNRAKPKTPASRELGPRNERSFAPDRKDEDSAGAKGKSRKRSVEADRDSSSR
jgi:hypothetical protein